ncbi:MAG: hypothetical protein AB1921_04085 [Thermodesulfobacteriota bacterium]
MAKSERSVNDLQVLSDILLEMMRGLPLEEAQRRLYEDCFDKKKCKQFINLLKLFSAKASDFQIKKDVYQRSIPDTDSSEMANENDHIAAVDEIGEVSPLIHAKFEPVHHKIVHECQRIARGEYSEHEISEGHKRREWFVKDKFYCDRLFEDVVFTLFTSWARLGDRCLRMGYIRKGSKSPDGVLCGAGINDNDLFYECKHSKHPCRIRDHEIQIRDHIQYVADRGRLPDNYLVIAYRFTPDSIERAQTLSKTPFSGSTVIVSLWEIEALHLFAGNYWIGNPRPICTGRRLLIFKGLLKEQHVTAFEVYNRLIGR